MRGGKHILLPDGNRGEVSFVFDHGLRRRGPGRPLWIYGTLEVGADDAIFIDGQQPEPYEPEPVDGPSLAADLWADKLFLSWLQDDGAALAVYSAIANKTFYKGDDDRGWEIGTRRAAALVARLRSLGESYQDYYPHASYEGPYPDDENRLELIHVAAAKADEVRAKIDQRAEILTGLPTTLEIPGQSIVVTTADELDAIFEEWWRVALKTGRIARKYAERIEAARERLISFRRSKNDPVMAEFKRHLSRLGWRAQRPADLNRERECQFAAVEQIWKEITDIQQRAPAPTPHWAKDIMEQVPMAAIFLRHVDDSGREFTFPAMPEAFLEQALSQLALSGRLGEAEYNELRSRIRAIDVSVLRQID